MDKTIFVRNFQESLDNNFSKYEKYFDYTFKVFFELRTSIFEVTKCLILELDKATITLTNNILERLLKLALIYNEVGLKTLAIEEWNSIYDEPNRKYGSISLGNSIELCLKNKIISQKEKDFLFDIIRELMRNGFSHADASKVLENLPNEILGYKGSLNNTTKLEEVFLNHKIIPPLQSIEIDNFAKMYASKYFEFVFTLIGIIETRLLEKNK